jgi:hypothetical protein
MQMAGLAFSGKLAGLVDVLVRCGVYKLLISSAMRFGGENAASRLGTALVLVRSDASLFFSFLFYLFQRPFPMKAALFSFVAAAALFITTAASAAAPFDHDHDRDLRRMSPRERARYEQVQRERDRRAAIERARWEAQHRHDRGPSYGYGYGYGRR